MANFSNFNVEVYGLRIAAIQLR